MKQEHLPEKATRDVLRSHFRDVYKLDDDQIEIMLKSSAQSLNGSLESLFSVLDSSENPVETAKLAHSIKGLLLNMGLSGWADIARNLEINANDFTRDQCLELAKTIEEGIEEIL